MNMQTVQGSAEPPSGPKLRSLGLAFMLTSESSPDVMDPKPQSLCSSFSITAANGRKDSKLPSSSSEIGDARPKPPVKPKPCVLPKPAVPVKPMPGLRQTLSEVPSAEKINLLAGPKPYSSGAGSAVKRLSFNLKCSPREVTNGKEAPSSLSTASKSSADKEDAEPTKKSSAIETAPKEECRESSSVAKCTLPFKVKPVPVATKPERFPGTTVEEILAKIEKPSESSPSFDRPRLVRSFFSQDGGSSVHLGPKGYVAFRRSSSGEEGVGTDSEGLAYRVSCEIKERSLSRNKELKEENRSLNEQHASESQQPETEVKRNEIFLPTDSSSSQPSVSCEGDQVESSSPPSSPGTKFSSRVTPGSPDAPSETTQPPGAPYLPTDVPCSEALLPPGSPDGSAKSSRSPLVDSVSHVQFADSPVTTADPWPPGSPIKTSPGQSLVSDLADVSSSYSEVPLLPEHTASLSHPPVEYNLQSHQCLTGVSESPGSPSILSKCHVYSDQPPGSPSCIPDTLLNRERAYLKNQAQILPLKEKAPLLNQRRASEGVVQPQGKKMVREELGGSLAALPREKDPSVEQTLGGESSWSLSQSFEWSFPNQGLELGGKRLVSPPNSPIQEHDDDDLLEAELGGEIPPIQGSYQEAGSEGQIGKEEETETSEHSANKESERNWKKIEGQLETQSTLELSAPGGPSVQRKIGSPNLKGPVEVEEVTVQEDHDDFLQFSPNYEEEALRAMEPLPSVEETAPPAESCILFSESAQVQTADTCQEECDALGMAQEAKMGNSDLVGGIEPDPSSHWLDELLASPPPSADDTKKRSTSEVEDPTGPQDLLGWSRKDLHSEFGIVGADHSDTFRLDWTADVTKVKWLGEMEQDREFGTGSQDWPNSYPIDLSDQKVTVNLEESTDNLIHQAGNLTNLAMGEPRGIGEGEPEWTQHLDTGELAISGDLKLESLEAYKKPVEKHLDWVPPFGVETSSASSNTRLVDAEGGREPDVGQADFMNNMDVSDSEKIDISDLRPKALDGAEVAYRDERCLLGTTGLEDDVMQHQGATPVCGESRKCHSQRLSSPSCLLEGMLSSSANRLEVQQKRPASFHSCHAEEERKLNNLPRDLAPAVEKVRPSPFPLEDVGEVLSDVDGDISQLNSGNGSKPPERQSESQDTQPVSQDDCASEGAEALTREKFIFLEDTETLDNSAHRDRANLGRKRGHRAPVTRAGGTVLENDRNSWMFRDSTEPQLVSTISDEELHEESKSKKSRSSPLSKGVKVALFPGLSPSALKAKLRGRNRSAEEGESQGEVKEAPVQRSKSCKMGSTSGKPLVLPPKPEKSSGSETSSPNWLQVLKLKKKKS
ncbi:182 kDa tankyrase-1-binding protein isoform X5 [Pseudonaja textilis]|uniref:182 kDa tankyrase-1-binding protein isoform X5 n=1 Tax=Pseudonaja textilis TaxID=8673 RepID=UPI000EAA8E48|nr:182 kDa tankyrase-1-binding protein isoform X5 [Pseudonaja textilis]